MNAEHTSDAGDRLARLARRIREIPGDDDGPCAPVAVAVDDSGTEHVGRTIRASAPGLGACATRIALAAARAAGDRPVTLLVARAARPLPRLCGLCRQTLAELAPDAALHLVDTTGAVVEIDHLLPRAFRLQRDGEGS